ncbi:MAG: phosphate acyltransferase, partial [Pseudomonadota bacterium]
MHLRMRIDKDFDLVDPDSDPRYPDYWQSYHKIMARSGVTPAHAKTLVRTDSTIIGSLLVSKGEADGLICGSVGSYREHLMTIIDIIGLKPGIEAAAAMPCLLHPTRGPIFICDTHVNPDPTSAQ